MASSSKVLSCGVVPFREHDGALQLLVIQHRGGHWGFPKGRREAKDKNDLDNALRELSEETGLSAEQVVIDPAEQIREEYRYQRRGAQVSKVVIFFIGKVLDPNAAISVPLDELRAYRWVSFKECATLLGKRSSSLLAEINRRLPSSQ